LALNLRFDLFVAFLAIVHDESAFAARPAVGHTEQAFQASSPKTSTARPATVGPFFVRNPQGAISCALQRNGRADSFFVTRVMIRRHAGPGIAPVAITFSVVAFFAIGTLHFALAQKPVWGHKDPAFQASSPKLFKPGFGRVFFCPQSA
jgi:hypothetical protein